MCNKNAALQLLTMGIFFSLFSTFGNTHKTNTHFIYNILLDYYLEKKKEAAADVFYGIIMTDPTL
jgi:hypothetical protein